MEGVVIKTFNYQKVHYIDNIPTVLTHVKTNVAHGYMINSDLTTTQCVVVRYGNLYSHGATKREALVSMQEKIMAEMSIEDRVEWFYNKYPDLDEKISNNELFSSHGNLTGSCKIGREQFIKNHSIDLSGKTTVRQFIDLCESAYNTEAFNLLKGKYSYA